MYRKVFNGYLWQPKMRIRLRSFYIESCHGVLNLPKTACYQVGGTV